MSSLAVDAAESTAPINITSGKNSQHANFGRSDVNKDMLLPAKHIFTLHGSAHITNPENPWLYRLVWLAVFLFFLIIGAYWSILTYKHWETHLTLTAIKSTGLPISQIDFPAITVCGQGLITLDPIIKYQYDMYLKTKNVSSLVDNNNNSSQEDVDAEWMKRLISDLYPGLDHDLDLDVIAKLVLANDPDKLIKSLVLTKGGFDPCYFGPIETCPEGWIDVPGSKNCLRFLGEGTFMDDPCPAVGGHLVRIAPGENLDSMKNILTKVIPTTKKEFWLDILIDTTNNKFVFYGSGIALDDLNNTVERRDDATGKRGKCIKAGLDGTKFIVYVVNCNESKAVYICAREIITCNNSKSFFDHSNKEYNYEKSVNLLFSPSMQKDLVASIVSATDNIKKAFQNMDKTRSFDALFELLWHSEQTCYNSDANPFPAMIRECTWKNIRVPCSALFNKIPTDKGICCAFNIKGIDMLQRGGALADHMIKHQALDYVGIEENEAIPDWWNGIKVVPKTGRDNGLSFTLDGNWYKLPASSIGDNFRGFTAIVDAPNQYPLTEIKRKISIMPGHENLISLTAFKVTTDESVFHLAPKERQCFFPNEFKLSAHRHYTRSNCLLECSLNTSLAHMSHKCIPWYYPNPKHIVMCDPWEASYFRSVMSDVSIDENCSHCLPECSETQYTASLSTAPFRTPCDITNIGRSTFCDFDFVADRDLHIWGTKVLEKYKILFKEWVDSGYKTDPDAKNYDPYVTDIAQVYIFFESPTIIEYSRETRLTLLELVGQIGGLMGLCLGLSLVSVIEVVYYIIYATLTYINRIGSSIGGKIRNRDRVVSFS